MSKEKAACIRSMTSGFSQYFTETVFRVARRTSEKSYFSMAPWCLLPGCRTPFGITPDAVFILTEFGCFVNKNKVVSDEERKAVDYFNRQSSATNVDLGISARTRCGILDHSASLRYSKLALRSMTI